MKTMAPARSIFFAVLLATSPVLLTLSTHASVPAARASHLTDIVRKSDGSVRYMYINEADDYCSSHGMRLPTAREYALYAQSLGAEGVSDIAKEGYYLINGYDAVGDADNFYFSNKGYQRPAGELGNRSFWALKNRYASYLNGIYSLDGRTGELFNHLNGTPLDTIPPLNVRCMSN
jgi:hypothetical protein